MPEVAISALTAATGLTDDDVLIVNDGATTKKITAANARGGLGFPVTGVDNTRTVKGAGDPGARSFAMMFGAQNTGYDAAAGEYLLSTGWLFGGTPASIAVQVDTASSPTGNFHVVVYNIDSDDGLPSTLAASWGPFDGSSTGAITLTSQSTVSPSGWYWYGIHASNANTGALTIQCLDRRYGNSWLFGDASLGQDAGLSYTGATTTPAADLSAVTTFNTSDSGNGPVKIGVA